MLFEAKLSPTTSYYIRKLLHQSEQRWLTSSVLSKLGSTTANLDQILFDLYPQDIQYSKIIQRLEGLVTLHKTLYSQITLYPDYIHEIDQLEQNIFSIFGLSLTKSC
jgi:hypothetical protein